METFNEKKYTVCLEAYDQLDYSFNLETWYKPAFASELETLINFIEGGCCKWLGKNVLLAQKDYSGFVRMICNKIAERLIDDQEYRNEFFNDLNKCMNQMFDHTNSRTKKLSKADKEMCLNSARGLKNYLPQISTALENPDPEDTRTEIVEYIGMGLYFITLQYFEIVRIESIKVTEQ